MFFFTHVFICKRKNLWIEYKEAVCDFVWPLVVIHGVCDPLAERADLEAKRIHRNQISASLKNKYVVPIIKPQQLYYLAIDTHTDSSQHNHNP